MRHAREDYNRIQDPAIIDPSLLSEGATPIGEDEPVFLLRAQDKLAPDILNDYADAAIAAGADDDLINKVQEHASAMRKWQAQNGCKTPDVTPTSGDDGKGEHK